MIAFTLKRTLRKTRTIALVLLCLGAAAVAGPLAAQQNIAARPEQRFSQQDVADLARIEAYLNQITTVQSGFVQLAANGSTAQGTLYVKRPGKLRVEYDPPVRILMVATGIWFIFHDGEMGETTYLPQRSTPISLLLEEEISLAEDTNIVEFQRLGDALRLTVTGVEDEEGLEGTLVLTFRRDPLALKEWTVQDAQGNVTRLALLNPQFGVDIPAVRFLFVSPVEDDSSYER